MLFVKIADDKLRIWPKHFSSTCSLALWLLNTAVRLFLLTYLFSVIKNSRPVHINKSKSHVLPTTQEQILVNLALIPQTTKPFRVNVF